MRSARGDELLAYWAADVGGLESAVGAAKANVVHEGSSRALAKV
jgi:hypothetical protein